MVCIVHSSDLLTSHSFFCPSLQPECNPDDSFILMVHKCLIFYCFSCQGLYLVIFCVFFLVFQSDQNCPLVFSVIDSHKYIGQFGGFML